MRTTPTTLRMTLAALGALALLGAPAAATASDTTTSFTVAASGSLAISQGSSTANAGSASYSAGSSTSVTGTLPSTTITDSRGTPGASWSVKVKAMGAFVHGVDSGITVPASAGRVYMDAANPTAMATALGGSLSGMTLTGGAYTDTGAENLGTEYTLVSGTTTLGNGSVTYTPGVKVTIPAATPAGTYSAVVRQTAM